MKQDREEENPTLLTPLNRNSFYAMHSTETIEIPDNLSPDEVKQLLGSAYFSQNARLTFQIETASRLLTINPGVLTYLGRMAESDGDSVSVDLSMFDARAHGVSRRHAALHRSGVSLAIEDCASTNGTYLNGSRLPPHQRQTLRDGDELRLGRLRIRLAFQYG